MNKDAGITDLPAAALKMGRIPSTAEDTRETLTGCTKAFVKRSISWYNFTIFTRKESKIDAK